MQIAKLFFIIISAATLLGGCGDGTLNTAAWNNNAAEAKRLIANGADVNAKNEDGWTPLHLAAIQNAAEVAKVLIANGAEVNANDNRGNTPLYWAESSQDDTAEVKKVLIANGAEY